MRVPYEWLGEFIKDLPEPEVIAKSLTLRGLEVESMERINPAFRGVVVGQIESVIEHPQSPNLKVVGVKIGVETLRVVCGATNVSQGIKVPLALPGSLLPGGKRIDIKKILGVVSEGMICSEKELGISDDESGICILPDDLEVGTELESASWFRDVIFDVNCPPNRGDLLSVLGIAREVASITKKRITLYEFEDEKESEIENYISLNVEDQDATPRYILRMIKDVKVGKSPLWMRLRLEKCGMRPINTIVDVTNYVMLELGQPLHAFDYDRLAGKKIEVKLSNQHMTFTTLDGQMRLIEPGDLLICDGSGPVALAGIMGGENSEIRENTRVVALESAVFDPLRIRRTSRRLNIKSEASVRFEKGVDIEGADLASRRAICLMHEVSGGTVIPGKLECKKEHKRKSVYVNIGRVNEVLGTNLKREEIKEALSSIMVNVEKEDESGILFEIPSFRHDINEYMDIVEEIARIKGYEHIPDTLPFCELKGHKDSKKEIIARTTRDYLIASGFYEIINFSFFGEKDLSSFFLEPQDQRKNAVRILNPISKEFSLMRTFLLPGILRTISYNTKRGEKNLRVFEIGHVFFDKEGSLPIEKNSLAIALTGKERDLFWKEKFTEYDFFDIKGVVEGLMQRYRIEFSLLRSYEPYLLGKESCDVIAQGKKIGWIGRVRDDVLRVYEIEQKVYAGEFDFDLILELAKIERKMKPIPKYPFAFRDFSFYVDDEIPVGDLVEKIKSVSDLISNVVVFDVFRKEKRSVTFRVFFQSERGTLREEELDMLQDKIIKQMNEIDGVGLRT